MKHTRHCWPLIAATILLLGSIGLDQTAFGEASLPAGAQALSSDIQLYAEAHRRSLLVCDSLERVRIALAKTDREPSDLQNDIITAKRQYFSIRADLFMAIYVHVSTIRNTD